MVSEAPFVPHLMVMGCGVRRELRDADARNEQRRAWQKKELAMEGDVTESALARRAHSYCTSWQVQKTLATVLAVEFRQWRVF